jgi:MFS family permease
MKSRPRFFLFHYAGFAFASAVVVSGASWFPAHMGRTFGWGAMDIGLSLGITLIIAALIGKTVAGKVMDEMFRRGRKDAQLRWYVGCLIAAVPTSVIAYTSSSPAVFLIGAGVTLMLLQPLPVCAYTSLNLVTPNNLRGTGVAFFAATAGLVGGGLGPILVPAAGALFGSRPSSLGLGLATVATVCCPIAATLLSMALRPMREAVQASELNA